jgi:rhodanese-related sulfurtransferase
MYPMKNPVRVLIVALFASVLAMGGCARSQCAPATSSKSFAAVADITPTTAKALLDSDPSITYIDVRTVKEFEAGHPAGAWNIPVFVFDDQGGRAKNVDFLGVVEANFDKDAKLIVGCRSGSRSKMAQGFLKDAGFTNTINMLGGFNGAHSANGAGQPGWSQLSLPTESGTGGDRGYEAVKMKAGG